jgi:hypothetical protein
VRTTSRRALAAIAAALVAVELASPSAAVAAPHPAKPASGHAVLTARHGYAPKRAGQGLAAPRSANLRQLVRAARAKRPAAADRAMAPRSDLATPSGANVTSQFDGITQATPGIGYDTEAVSATNGNQILEIASNFVQVTDNNGAVQCGGGITVAHILRSSGIFIQPQVMYDNFQGHFIMTTSPVNLLSSPGPRSAAITTAGHIRGS